MNKPILLGWALATIAGCTFMSEDLPYEVQAVVATVETAPMSGRGDKADDPAIWVHPNDTSRSLILATNKAEGLYVYDLYGRELQRLLVGLVNNVDIRGNLAVVSNDGVNGLSWFRIDPDNASEPVHHLGDTAVSRIEPYGICIGRVGTRTLAGVTYKDGALELWRVEDQATGTPAVDLSSTVMFDSQLEGCVFDDDNERLFIGEEEFGVWTLDLSRSQAPPMVVDRISDGNGLVADVEGLAIYRGPGGTGYLLASAQEADRFVIYDRRAPYDVVGAIAIRPNQDSGIDAVSHTDGIGISAVALPGFPRGVLVVQDDGNPRSGVDQNFKYIDWRQVEDAILDLRSSAAATELQ